MLCLQAAAAVLWAYRVWAYLVRPQAPHPWMQEPFQTPLHQVTAPISPQDTLSVRGGQSDHFILWFLCPRNNIIIKLQQWLSARWLCWLANLYHMSVSCVLNSLWRIWKTFQCELGAELCDKSNFSFWFDFKWSGTWTSKVYLRFQECA